MSAITEPATLQRSLQELAERPPQRDGRAPRNRLHRVARVVGYIVLVIAAAALLVPFFWMVSSSLKPANDVFSVPVKWLPQTWDWSNYVNIWTHSNIVVWIRNTLVLAVAVTILQVFTGSFAAYGFARVKFRGRDALFLAYIATIAKRGYRLIAAVRLVNHQIWRGLGIRTSFRSDAALATVWGPAAELTLRHPATGDPACHLTLYEPVR